MPLYIVRKNIAEMKCDAIVNTTNRAMIGYSGVDRALHEAGGPEFEEECNKAAPVELGLAKRTKGGALSCKYVIHTVGPTWYGGNRGEKALLKSCYRECLELAEESGCASIAFPLISSGAHGYPKDRVLSYAVEIIRDFLKNREMTVYLCVYDRTSYEFSQALFSDLSRYIGSRQELPVKAAFAAEAPMPMEVDASKVARAPKAGAPKGSLKEYVKAQDKSFIDALQDIIEAQGLTNAKAYHLANVSVKTFNKLVNNPNQKPSKSTACAFAIALKLSLEEAQALLARAGLTLGQSSKFDLIVRYFLERGGADVFEVNEALFEFDEALLGSV